MTLTPVAIGISEDELQELLIKLTDIERRYQTQPSLSAYVRGEMIENPLGELNAIKKHRAFNKLFVSNKLFADALQSFHKREFDGLKGASSKNLEYMAPAFEVRFISTILFCLLRLMLETRRPELVAVADTRTRHQAARKARSILRFMKAGARLSNLLKQSELEDLLNSYVKQNEEKGRRTKNDGNNAKRVFVRRLAESFLAFFGETFTPIIVILAQAIDYKVDERSIERTVSEVIRAQNRERLPKRQNKLKGLLGGVTLIGKI